ncbi:MAG: hypothetical protein IPP90_09890 [Gemmatimonadaceae bacterium]|nr:hypothetical protein [Gemmatimonadaceae bacterium]
MPILRSAEHDENLSAVVISRRSLMYTAGADARADRPAHIRAASSLAWVNGQIALIQDDANFVALIDAHGGDAQAIVLPRGDGGKRQFDDLRGNKKFKLDLEACVAIAGEGGPTLLAFGSGSKRRRRHVVAVDLWEAEAPRVAVHDASSFYERLELETAFAGSDMNIEGALVVADAVRFFGRGNGKSRDGLHALNATCDVPLRSLLVYLRDAERAVPPAPDNITQYALGDLAGTPLGFTDATILGDAVLYSATAEQSDDASTDGPVTGSVLGVIERDGRVRCTTITDQSGRPFCEKVEGVLRSQTSTQSVYVVVDADDPTRPSELCEIALRGRWASGFS